MAETPAPPDLDREIKLNEIPVANTELEPPFRVIIHNDDITPFEFVVSVLRVVFHLSSPVALAITTEAHYTGLAHVVTLPHEEAKYRVGKAHSLARAAGYPLSFTIEPDA